MTKTTDTKYNEDVFAGILKYSALMNDKYEDESKGLHLRSSHFLDIVSCVTLPNGNLLVDQIKKG